MQFFILCPLKPELKYLAAALTNLGARIEPAGNFTRYLPAQTRPVDIRTVAIPQPDATQPSRLQGSAEAPEIYLGCGGHGKVRFALTAGLLLGAVDRQIKPVHAPDNSPTKILITAGACGALQTGMAPGDLFSPSAIVEHDYLQKFHAARLPRFDVESPPGWPSGDGLPVIHHGILASGDEDIVDSERAASLAAATGAKAVTWESAGGIRAARMYGAGYAELRCVTDNPALTHHHNKTGPSVVEEFKGNLQLGMASVAEVLYTYFRGSAKSTSSK